MNVCETQQKEKQSVRDSLASESERWEHLNQQKTKTKKKALQPSPRKSDVLGNLKSQEKISQEV
jgi:hypothetical protein